MPNLDALGIVVQDMGATIRFYRLLGLDVPETPDCGERLACSRRMAALPPCVDTASRKAQRSGAGRAANVQPWDAFWGQRYAQLRDPNGVPVDLYAAL